MDIHLGRGNANKLMNRCLYQLSQSINLKIHSIDGGSLRNAIPRESVAKVVIPSSATTDFDSQLQSLAQTLKAEYQTTDPQIQLLWEANSAVETVASPQFTKQLLRSIYACPNGIYRMSPDIDDLVQTSNNLARVLVANGNYEILCLTAKLSRQMKKWTKRQLSVVYSN